MGHIDELDLCKLIANELANHGPHDEQEVYGMLILLLRLRDGRQDKVTEPNVSDAVEQAFHNTPPVGSFVGKEYKPVVYTTQSTQDIILAPTKMRAQDRDALHIRILDMLETGSLTTRQISNRLGISFSDTSTRNQVGAHIRWLQHNGYITDAYINDATKRNALWQVKK